VSINRDAVAGPQNYDVTAMHPRLGHSRTVCRVSDLPSPLETSGGGVIPARGVAFGSSRHRDTIFCSVRSPSPTVDPAIMREIPPAARVKPQASSTQQLQQLQLQLQQQLQQHGLEQHQPPQQQQQQQPTAARRVRPSSAVTASRASDRLIAQCASSDAPADKSQLLHSLHAYVALPAASSDAGDGVDGGAATSARRRRAVPAVAAAPSSAEPYQFKSKRPHSAVFGTARRTTVRTGVALSRPLRGC
jgi:hypothetical protein